eukprot:GHVO01059362.1.p1 GENE.GHVO01059362.1~~GHVO01059362.1.p1  ORF type:complete len:107 (+),score=2.95 GHVO01059362.1:423-743(+)
MQHVKLPSFTKTYITSTVMNEPIMQNQRGIQMVQKALETVIQSANRRTVTFQHRVKNISGTAAEVSPPHYMRSLLWSIQTKFELKKTRSQSHLGVFVQCTSEAASS